MRANAYVVNLDLELAEPFLKFVHPGIEGGVGAVVLVELGSELPHHADEKVNPLREGVVSLVK